MEQLHRTEGEAEPLARMGVGDVAIIMPYAAYTASTAPHLVDPFHLGPVYEPNGAYLFFANQAQREDFLALCWVLGVYRTARYAGRLARSRQPAADGYLVQLRLLTEAGAAVAYAREEQTAAQAVDQPLALPESLYASIENQRAEWGTSFTDRRLDGLFGGDGDFAREELSFGFMIENAFHGIYRIWSRAWLVTK